jgi:hypothetical protein
MAHNKKVSLKKPEIAVYIADQIRPAFDPVSLRKH